LMSATPTLARSAKNYRAISLPMPLAAPVTGGYLLLRVRPSTSRLKHPWREDVGRSQQRWTRYRRGRLSAPL
jgi:hypothetical protein